MVKCYVKDYPRPQFVRRDWKNLNGTWDFTFDDKKEGEEKCWYETFPESRNIIVPFTYETQASLIGEEETHENIWYHNVVQVSEDNLAKNIWLHFEGSDYITKVWVNGQYAGCHKGAYNRFSFEISKLLKAGENHLTVKVEDSLDEQQPRGKQRWIESSFGCWYVQTTGIWKTVWMEYVEKSHISAVKMTPSVANQSVELEIEVTADVYDGTYVAEVAVTFDGKPVRKLQQEVNHRHLKLQIDMYSTKIHEWGIRTWAPGHPDLYEISFTLKKEEERVDFVESYFGMREVTIDGPQILLNGRPIYQRLILDQGYWKESHLTPPSEEALVEDIKKIISLGYNGVRKHQKIEDERFLYWCDIYGLLVWSEMGAAYRFTDRAVEDFTEQWLKIVKQNYNHPSIITWVPFNESWGISNVKTGEKEQNFTGGIYCLTKTIDSMRPVVSNDGWEHTKTDILTLHDYEALPELIGERYGHRKEEMLKNGIYHNGFKAALADGYAYKGQPIIISEFGGIALNNTGEGWGYGDKVADEEAFLKRFDGVVTAIKKLPYVCGYCYTQITDVQQEINGLLNEDRTYKVNREAIEEINKRYVGTYQGIYNA